MGRGGSLSLSLSPSSLFFHSESTHSFSLLSFCVTAGVGNVKERTKKKKRKKKARCPGRVCSCIGRHRHPPTPPPAKKYNIKYNITVWRKLSQGSFHLPRSGSPRTIPTFCSFAETTMFHLVLFVLLPSHNLELFTIQMSGTTLVGQPAGRRQKPGSTAVLAAARRKEGCTRNATFHSR